MKIKDVPLFCPLPVNCQDSIDLQDSFASHYLNLDVLFVRIIITSFCIPFRIKDVFAMHVLVINLYISDMSALRLRGNRASVCV